MIHRKDSCWGITLFRFGRRKLELWLVPASYECVEHTHKDSDGEFFVLYGKDREIYRKVMYSQIITDNTIHLDKQQYNISTRKYFKWLTVRANTPHGFSRGQSPMVFLCWETYRKGCRVTSPAIDFHPCKDEIINKLNSKINDIKIDIFVCEKAIEFLTEK